MDPIRSKKAEISADLLSVSRTSNGMEIDFQNLHHSYLVVGERKEAEAHLRELLLGHGIKLAGSPDFFVFNSPLFGIDEARELSLAASKKAFTDKKIFLISPEKITLEAQNALLKTFEEPTANTHFFLLVRDAMLVLPTLRSRMQIVYVEGKVGELSDAKKFLKLTIKDRINFSKKFVDADLPAGRQGKNLSVFLDELLITLKASNDIESLKEIYPLRLVSDDRGTSPRLILEHLSVVL